jgi:hypothetical protein
MVIIVILWNTKCKGIWKKQKESLHQHHLEVQPGQVGWGGTQTSNFLDICEVIHARDKKIIISSC